MVVISILFDKVPFVIEFVEGSYTHRGVSFRTYLTDIAIGSIISVRGLPYKVTAVRYEVDAVTMTCNITGERYEN